MEKKRGKEFCFFPGVSGSNESLTHELRKVSKMLSTHSKFASMVVRSAFVRGKSTKSTTASSTLRKSATLRYTGDTFNTCSLQLNLRGKTFQVLNEKDSHGLKAKRTSTFLTNSRSEDSMRRDPWLNS